MESLPGDAYRVTEVMTAPPQKLHLMLIEGAIRSVHKARQHWAAAEDQQAGEALIRAQEIVAQMLAGFRREADPELVDLVAAVYSFVYHGLVEASLRRDDARLADCLRILEIERDTWRQLCERSPSGPSDVFPPRPSAIPPIPPGALDMPPMETLSGRCSLEA
jgi:flagellar protein FliS